MLSTLLAHNLVKDLGYPLIALAILVVWVYVLVDLFRNPRLSGGAKAGWLLIIIIFPIIGSLVYLGIREDW
jgi:hypothetical protein